MRAFASVELPPPVREHLAAAQAAILPLIEESPAAFTSPEKLHLTIKFLGEVAEDGLGSLVESFQKIRRSGPMVLQAHEIECFPLRGPIRIIGASIGGDATALLGLQRAVEQRCQNIGFPAECRAFRPHVTLARPKPGLSAHARALLQHETDALWPGPSFVVHSFQLTQNVLRPTGAKYRMLRQFDFS